MAIKSGGTIPNLPAAMDADQALVMLDLMHHWGCTKINRDGGRTGYHLSITHAGRRVSAQRRTWIDAANGAMKKLRETETPKMRLVR